MIQRSYSADKTLTLLFDRMCPKYLQETSGVIAARLIDTEETEAVITVTREQYRVLAARGSVLYFVIASLAEIDPMYQYSLKYFTTVFCSVIAAPHEKLPLQERLKQLMNDEIYGLYVNVSRGLFEKHKLVYSFLLAIAVERQEGRIEQSEFDFLLRGPIAIDCGSQPAHLKCSEFAWKCCNYFQQEYPEFNGICQDLENTIHIEFGDFQTVIP